MLLVSLSFEMAIVLNTLELVYRFCLSVESSHHHLMTKPQKMRLCVTDYIWKNSFRNGGVATTIARNEENKKFAPSTATYSLILCKILYRNCNQQLEITLTIHGANESKEKQTTE